MLAFSLYIFLVVFFIVFIIFFGLLTLRTNKQFVIRSRNYQIIKKSELETFHFDPLHDDMNEIRELYSKEKISTIYLLHGTFIGDDPFGIVEILAGLFGKRGADIARVLKRYLKKGQDFVAKDLGNFTPEHEEILHSVFQGRCQIINQTWSSGNHHMARLRACLSLIEKLYKNPTNDNIVLVGHSHAGQVFALLTQFLYGETIKEELIFLSKELGGIDLEKKCKVISKYKLKFLTLGAPARYKWSSKGNYKLLHIINHRGQGPFGGSFSSSFFTKFGDYVQQWGIEGSDIISPIKSEHELNKKLNNVLGEGANILFLKERVKLRNRLHSRGRHLLVDYGDQSSFPNFYKTILGHGIYTRVKFLKFTLYQIGKY